MRRRASSLFPSSSGIRYRNDPTGVGLETKISKPRFLCSLTGLDLFDHRKQYFDNKSYVTTHHEVYMYKSLTKIITVDALFLESLCLCLADMCTGMCILVPEYNYTKTCAGLVKKTNKSGCSYLVKSTITRCGHRVR